MQIKLPEKRTKKKLDREGHIIRASELARMFGVTSATISNWRKVGMPVHRKENDRDYMFDSAACFHWRINHEYKLAGEIFQKELNSKTEAVVEEIEGEMSFTEAKTRREVANALMAELELAKALEQVANIDDLMDNFTDALVEVRAKIVSQSNRLSGILAHQESDAVRDILDKDSTETLEALSAYSHEYVEGE